MPFVPEPPFLPVCHTAFLDIWYDKRVSWFSTGWCCNSQDKTVTSLDHDSPRTVQGSIKWAHVDASMVCAQSKDNQPMNLKMCTMPLLLFFFLFLFGCIYTGRSSQARDQTRTKTMTQAIMLESLTHCVTREFPLPLFLLSFLLFFGCPLAYGVPRPWDETWVLELQKCHRFHCATAGTPHYSFLIIKLCLC